MTAGVPAPQAAAVVSAALGDRDGGEGRTALCRSGRRSPRARPAVSGRSRGPLTGPVRAADRVQRPVVRTMRKRADPASILSNALPASSRGASSVHERTPLCAAKRRVSSVSTAVPDAWP